MGSGHATGHVFCQGEEIVGLSASLGEGILVQLCKGLGSLPGPANKYERHTIGF